jgi:replicative DNA helicase
MLQILKNKAKIIAKKQIGETKMANNTLARKTPYSLEAEQSVLGSILISQTVAGELCATLNQDDFHSPIHQTIFVAMQSIVQKKSTS